MTNTKIIRFEAENFKRLQCVTITPDGATVVIGGRNAQGKSSVMDAISAVLGGGRLSPKDPIRHGQKRASIRLELEDLVITRKWGKSGSTIEVVSKERGKLKSPQAVLDRLTSSLSFDPLAFCNMKPTEQEEMLREMAGLDLSEIDAEIGRAFEARKELNATVKRLKGAAESATMHKGMPAEPVVISELLAEHKRRTEHNDARWAIGTKIDALLESATRIDERTTAARMALSEMESTHTETIGEVTRLRGKHSSGHDEDTDEVQAQIESAEETNAKVRDNIAAFKARQAHGEAEKAAEKATEKLKDAREARAKAIAGAKFPIEGLTVGEDGVEFEGVIFEQASGAQRIRVSAAIGLAMNPELKVLLIRDASLMDEESMAALHELAVEAEAQIWLEVVTTDKDVGIILEDGSVA